MVVNPLVVCFATSFIMLTLLVLIRLWILKRIRVMERAYSNQTADVWNISSRVNQERPVTSEPTGRWPTHDAHISLDSFVIPDSLQAYKTDRVPPPPYTEVDLPSYEQAIGTPTHKDTVIEMQQQQTAPSSSRSVDS